MQQRVQETVSQIYDTIADVSLWPAVLDRIADETGARGCIVFEWQGYGEDRRLHAPYMSARYDPGRLERYLAAFHKYEAEDQDVFEARSLAADAIDLISDNVLADSEESLLQRPHVQTLLSFDMRYRYAGLLNKDNRAIARFSMQYTPEHGPMRDEAREKLGLFLPAVAKALDLGGPAKRLAETQKLLLAGMDALNVGFCFLDQHGRVVTTNAEFDRQCDAYEAFRITPEGRLTLHSGADGGQFEALTENSLNHGRFGARPRKEAIAVNRDESYDALCIEISPLEKSEEIGSTPLKGFVLRSLDTSRRLDVDAGLLQPVFGLTNTETALAGLVGTGLTNQEIADQRERSVETVNAQVKSLLLKTGCANRTQFVRLLTTFGVTFLSP